MSQLVLVRCPKCKRRYAQHGEGGCPFCAAEVSAREAPASPKVVVHGNAVAEVVRQPTRRTPPPQAGTADSSGTPDAALEASTPAGEGAASGERRPEKRRAVILRPSPPVKVGPIVLPRRVWMSIVGIAVLVAGSVMAWEVTHGANEQGSAGATAIPELPRSPADNPDGNRAEQATSRGGTGGAEARDEQPGQAVPAEGTPGSEATTAAGHFRQGTRYFMDGNLAGAQTQFEAAIALDPGYCAAHRALGVVHATRQDGRSSVEAYLRYLQCGPRVADDAEIQRRIAGLGSNSSASGDGRR